MSENENIGKHTDNSRPAIIEDVILEEADLETEADLSLDQISPVALSATQSIDEISLPEQHSYAPGASMPRPTEALQSSSEESFSTQGGKPNNHSSSDNIRTGPEYPPNQRPQKTKQDKNIGRVLGSYRILSLIGAGGMGQVYQAEHTVIGRRVAIKILRPEYAVKQDAVRRFIREAKAVNAISHENIVDIIDCNEGGPNETFIIMELLEGKTLSELMKERTTPLPFHRAMQIALQVCEALHAAHEKGIVHRDLKPDNIFIIEQKNEEDFVKLLDFGVAKLTQNAETQSSYQTAVGAVIGTPAYMSPEQASGTTIDNRTDIYSFGAILYELFTGHPVFKANSFSDFIIKHVTRTPTPPRNLADAPKIPAALEALILQCLEKNPNDRYQSVLDLREDLSRATATLKSAISKIPQRSENSTLSKTKKHRALWMAFVMGLVFIAAVFAFLWAAGILGGSKKAADQPQSHTPVTPHLRTKTATPSSPLVKKQKQKETDDPPKKEHLISLHSSPQGATIYTYDQSKVLGTTPHAIRVKSDVRALSLTFKKEGFYPKTETIDPRHRKFTVKLDPLPLNKAVKRQEKKKKYRQSQKRKSKALRVVDPDKNKTKKKTRRKTKTKTSPPSKTIKKNEQVDPFA